MQADPNRRPKIHSVRQKNPPLGCAEGITDTNGTAKDADRRTALRPWAGRGRRARACGGRMQGKLSAGLRSSVSRAPNQAKANPVQPRSQAQGGPRRASQACVKARPAEP